MAELQSEAGKAAQVNRNLEAQMAQKERQLAELEAATSGEIARLSATLEATRGDLHRVEQQLVGPCGRCDGGAVVGILGVRIFDN